MYNYEGLSGLGRSFTKRFNPVAATKAAIKNVIAPVLKSAPAIIMKPQTALTLTKEKILRPVINSATTLTKKTVINPTQAMMTTASPKSLLTAGRQGGVSAVIGTAVSSLQSPKAGTAEVQQAETSIMDGPLVTIYDTNGSEAQIPNNYLTNGTYTDETGMVWSTKNPVMAASVESINSFTSAYAGRGGQGHPWTPKPAPASIMAPVSASNDTVNAGSMIPMNETVGTGGPIAADQKNQALKMSFVNRLAELMRRPGA